MIGSRERCVGCWRGAGGGEDRGGRARVGSELGGLEPGEQGVPWTALRPPSACGESGHPQPSGAGRVLGTPRSFPAPRSMSLQVPFPPSPLLQENSRSLSEDRLTALPSAPMGPRACTAACFKARGSVPSARSWVQGLASHSPEGPLVARGLQGGVRGRGGAWWGALGRPDMSPWRWEAQGAPCSLGEGGTWLRV